MKKFTVQVLFTALYKDTSGLLVIAKNNDVHQKLAQQISENKMNREYIAIVDGHFAHETGVIDAHYLVIKRIV